MPTYKAPVEDALFLLNDVFHLDHYGNLPGFSDASPDVVEAVLREAAKFSEEVLTPLNRVGDKEGCKRAADGSVSTPKGFKDAYKQIVEGGWIGISVPAEFGGQGLPATLTEVVNEFFCSSNMAFAMYPGLTQGAIAALLVHASDELKKKYLPKMVEGVWTGTMKLTEPHCGTDLGLLRSKAVKQPDGSYKISGTKIFISAGEHDLSQNIIHLVLARIEGAPAGTKGISLFVVPKFMVRDDGSLGARNAVSCGAIEHKMGWHMQSTRQVIFEDCKVPAENLLSGEGAGFGIAMAGLDGGRLNIAACSLGGAQAAYDKSVAYLADRQAFGMALLDEPTIRFTLADMATTLQTSRNLLWRAASALDSVGQNSRPISASSTTSGMLRNSAFAPPASAVGPAGVANSMLSRASGVCTAACAAVSLTLFMPPAPRRPWRGARPSLDTKTAWPAGAPPRRRRCRRPARRGRRRGRWCGRRRNR